MADSLVHLTAAPMAVLSVVEKVLSKADLWVVPLAASTVHYLAVWKVVHLAVWTVERKVNLSVVLSVALMVLQLAD